MKYWNDVINHTTAASYTILCYIVWTAIYTTALISMYDEDTKKPLIDFLLLYYFLFIFLHLRVGFVY